MTAKYICLLGGATVGYGSYHDGTIFSAAGTALRSSIAKWSRST
ncbi:MAG TPA: hypothetical protein VNU44_19765 [Bryobacteraceae bacterium]|nr:hypothetical protein [Bryobacteraceae bacterium]